MPASLDELASLSAPASRIAAATAMLEAWRTPVPLSPGTELCSQVGAVGLACLAQQGSWASLLRLDRPALLEISMPGDAGTRHVALLGIRDGTATVGVGAQRFELALDRLEGRWLGRATVFWQLPPGYREPTRRGDISAAADWLHDRLETLAGRTPFAPAGTVFDAGLEARVRALQTREGLVVDGIAGPETWMRINALTGVGVPTLRGGAQR